MALREELKKQGNWLFRWRSYIPLVMIIILFWGMSYFEYFGHSEKLDDIWEIICLFISFLGMGIRFFTVGYTPKETSGTNTRKQIAETLNTTGMYSITRHPLYLGNFIIWLGLSSFLHLWWFSLIVVVIFWLYYERIMFAEEEFLREKFGNLYLEWAEKTPTFIPNLWKWHSSDMTFSFRKAIKNEYKTFFAIIISFTIVEIISDIFVVQTLEIDGMWLSILVIGLAIYVIIRFLKKRTKILNVQGR